MERLAAGCGASEPVLRSSSRLGCGTPRLGFDLDFTASFPFANGSPCSSANLYAQGSSTSALSMPSQDYFSTGNICHYPDPLRRILERQHSLDWRENFFPDSVAI